MNIARQVTTEILDTLPVNAPEALRSRRDLRRINRIMGNSRLLVDLLRRLVPQPPLRVLEIGAGDGATSLAIAARLAATWPGVRITLVERLPLIGPAQIDAFARLGWSARPVVGDALDYLTARRNRSFDVVFANLFLHHFDEGLPALLHHIGRIAPVFVAMEPRRGALALTASRLVALVGANGVTRHDALASVRAGFCGNEISALWPRRPGDLIKEGRCGPFTHGFGVFGAADCTR